MILALVFLKSIVNIVKSLNGEILIEDTKKNLPRPHLNGISSVVLTKA